MPVTQKLNLGMETGGDAINNSDQSDQQNGIEAISDKLHIPLWAIAIAVLVILLVIVIVLYCVCKRCMKKKGRDLKKSTQFMRGIAIEPTAPPPWRQAINTEPVQPGIGSLPTAEESEVEEEEEEEKLTNNLGKLHYTMTYDYDKEELIVGIVNAIDLPAKDRCGTSDPYVKVYFQDERKHKKETKIHKKKLNPIFNEKFVFKKKYVEMKMKVLVMAVYDFDLVSKHDPIGQVALPLNTVDLCEVVDEIRDLTSLDEHKQAPGELCFTLKLQKIKDTKTTKLSVRVMEAKNLKPMDFNGLSDPYVKLQLMLNGKRLDKHKTTIKDKTLNPYYNEIFRFEVADNQLMNVLLVLTVIDYDRMNSNDPIGQVVVGSRAGGSGQAHWNELIELMVDDKKLIASGAPKNHAVAKWHTLQEID